MISSINIHVDNEIKTFEIGTSQSAKQAIHSYSQYQQTRKYEDLKNCFVHLHHTVDKDPSRNQNVCMACHELARSVYSSESNLYKKFFIANSVSSIIINANLHDYSLNVIKMTWDKNMIQNGLQIKEKGFDAQAADKAGLILLNI